jgi:hypothetical protein
LYWRAKQFHGNRQLETSQIVAMHGKLKIFAYRGTTVGAALYLKRIKHGVMIGRDSVFTNENLFGALSADAFVHYNSAHWELSGSATLQQFGSFLTSQNRPLPVNQTQRIWFKASAYVKGYLFQRATYIKFGLAGMASPQAYQPEHYYPSLDFWHPSGTNGSFIPSFNRLDVDISARVRWIMFDLRYENVLDGVTQLGYFETAGYPMPARRFIFGLRVFFRD